MALLVERTQVQIPWKQVMVELAQVSKRQSPELEQRSE